LKTQAHLLGIINNNHLIQRAPCFNSVFCFLSNGYFRHHHNEQNSSHQLLNSLIIEVTLS